MVRNRIQTTGAGWARGPPGLVIFFLRIKSGNFFKIPSKFEGQTPNNSETGGDGGLKLCRVVDPGIPTWDLESEIFSPFPYFGGNFSNFTFSTFMGKVALILARKPSHLGEMFRPHIVGVGTLDFWG